MSDLSTIIKLNCIFKAHLVSSQDVALGVKKISFQVSQPFNFFPWQYVWVELPTLTIPDPHGSRRAFSIFNTVNDSNIIEIVARINDTGFKQSLFALSPGDEVIIHGPFGSSFVINENSDKNIIMIAGGVGIAAFLNLIQTIKSYSTPQRCFLVYLNKEPKSTPFLSELEELKKTNSFFDFKVIYGHFSWDHISSEYTNLSPNLRLMITGPQLMVDDIFNNLKSANVPRNQMEFENYYPTTKNNLTRSNIEGQLKANNLFATALQNSTSHTVITDANGVVLFANKAAQQITGFTETEILGNTPRLWGGMMSHEFYVNLWKDKQAGIDIALELINRKKNGQLYYTMAHISRICDNGGEIIGYIATEEDITELEESKKQLIEKVQELERLNKTMVSRELKMIELKAEIKKLQNQGLNI